MSCKSSRVVATTREPATRRESAGSIQDEFWEKENPVTVAWSTLKSRKHSRWRPWSLRCTLFALIDCVTAAITLLTIMRDNLVLVNATSKYTRIRTRLQVGAINYNLQRSAAVNRKLLPDLASVGASWRFFQTPGRNRKSMNKDGSVCMRVNSMSAEFLAIGFDDAWGRNVRREQTFVFNISPPNCSVINLQPTWLETNCSQLSPSSASDDSSSASRCHQFLLEHFDMLLQDATVQMAMLVDGGGVGAPFLRCSGRPEVSFDYLTDLMVLQSYWAGGPIHAEFQTSKCLAVPLATRQANVALYQVQSKDDNADVVFAVDQTNWCVFFVSWAHSLATLAIIVRGMFNVVQYTRKVRYVPWAVRFPSWLAWLKSVPLPSIILAIWSPRDPRHVITLESSTASIPSAWMNHWLYCLICSLDALMNMRTTTIILQMAVYMLAYSVNVSNVVFLLSGVTKSSWLICVAHFTMRILAKLLLRVATGLGLMRKQLMKQLDWYVDASTMFVSYRLYSGLLYSLMLLVFKIQGKATFMARQVPPKFPVYGADSGIESFWLSECMCDLQVYFLVLVTVGSVSSLTLVTCTKYRYAANNSVLRALQNRYVLVGWDVFAVMRTLRIDPFNSALVDTERGVAVANCTLGTLIQLLYASGPSGSLQLVGDGIFVPSQRRRALAEHMGMRVYPCEKVLAMQLIDKIISRRRAQQQTQVEQVEHDAAVKTKDESLDPNLLPPLRLVSESAWGALLLMSASERLSAGRRLETNTETQLQELAVQDALVTMPKRQRPQLVSGACRLYLA